MSFSLALALGCGDASTVTATSHEDEATVRRVFPGGGGRHIDELRRLGCTVLFGVDATALEATFKEGERFDRIIWNFPCVARGIGEGMDGQNEEVDRTVHQTAVIDADTDKYMLMVRWNKTRSWYWHSVSAPQRT